MRDIALNRRQGFGNFDSFNPKLRTDAFPRPSLVLKFFVYEPEVVCKNVSFRKSCLQLVALLCTGVLKALYG